MITGRLRRIPELRAAVRCGRDLLKAGVAGAFAAPGALDLFTRVRTAATGPRIHVLGYHRVVDHLPPGRFDPLDDLGEVNPSLCITTLAFRRQMLEARERYRMLSLVEAMDAIAGRLPLDRDACVVTFDDGYRDVFLRARPLLAELGIPGTVFIPSGYAGTGRYLPHDRLYAGFARALGADQPLPSTWVAEEWRPALARAREVLKWDGAAEATESLLYSVPAAGLDAIADALERMLGPAHLDEGGAVLSPGEVAVLAREGWEIGAHTIGHLVLTFEDDDSVEKQLSASRRAIEEWSGKPCRYFAYCNGLHSPRIRAAVARAGYAGAVTTHDRPNHPGGDVMRVHRKCLWEGHARGPRGGWSQSLSRAHMVDLFGTLGMTSPVNGELAR